MNPKIDNNFAIKKIKPEVLENAINKKLLESELEAMSIVKGTKNILSLQ